MALTINQLVRKFATYADDSVTGVAEADVISTLIPMAEKIFYEMTLDTMSISNYTSSNTTNSVADFCIAHLSCYVMDHMKDRVHVDPESGLIENRHWQAAYNMMLAVWGILYQGEKVLPGEVAASTPTFFLGRVDAQLKQAEWKNTAVKTLASKEKYEEVTGSSS